MWGVRRLQEVDKLRATVANLSLGPVRIASLCSGFEIFGMVMFALKEAFADLPPGKGQGCLEVLFICACELDERKRSLIKRMHPELKHLFSDVVELAKGKAWDDLHGAPDELDPQEYPHIVAAGFPCIDFSGLNPARTSIKFNRRGSSTSSGGTSSRVFRACVACIQQWQPALVLFENVKQVLQCRAADNGARPIDSIDEATELT